MTLQQAKDQAASGIEGNYGNFDNFSNLLEEGNAKEIEYAVNRALEIYGNAQWNAAIEKAAEIGLKESECYYEHDVYKSILKLKKP